MTEMISNEAESPRSKWFRFGLLDLLLLTAAVASWLPTLRARQQIPVLESKVASMSAMSGALFQVDDQQLCLRLLPKVSYQVDAWKYFAPAGADLELRFATEGIHKFDFPEDYQAVKLPTGEHRIFLKSMKNSQQGYLNELFIDDQQVLKVQHPESWNDSSGSSWSGDVTIQSKAFDFAKAVSLQNLRYMVNNKVRKGGSAAPPDEYDAKGMFLWIAPSNLASVPAPTFLSPQTPKLNRAVWGLRQGIQVVPPGSGDLDGLLPIRAGYNAIAVDEYSSNRATNLVSVRPVVDRWEAPEIQQSQFNGQIGLAIGISNSMEPPPSLDNRFFKNRDATGVVSEDGRTMRLFCHYEKFASGALPIVELIFDADHPDRIGLLPHQSPGSVLIKECQFVTQLDTRYLQSRMELFVESQSSKGNNAANDDAMTERVDLKKLLNIQSKKFDSESNPSQNFDWLQIPFERLPISIATEISYRSRRLRISTEVTAFDKLVYPAPMDMKWKYEGVPNQQTWWIPDPVATEEGRSRPHVRIEILGTNGFPATQFNPTIAPIPGGTGGPVVQSVRITVPMPARDPIWLEISPKP